MANLLENIKFPLNSDGPVFRRKVTQCLRFGLSPQHLSLLPRCMSALALIHSPVFDAGLLEAAEIVVAVGGDAAGQEDVDEELPTEPPPRKLQRGDQTIQTRYPSFVLNGLVPLPTTNNS